MKRCFALVFIFLAVALAGAQAQGLDDDYVQIFNLIQQADMLSGTQPTEALAKYAQAQTALERLQRGSPDWNAKIVSFRLRYVADKMAALTAKAPAPATPAPTAPGKASGAPAGTPSGPEPATPAPPAPAAPAPPDWENQLNLLKEQARQLQADKAILEAKLKEAFALQPAAADPRELAKTEAKLKALQKENDLLKASIELEKSKPAPVADTSALEAARQALADANRDLAQAKAQVGTLEADKEALRLEKAALENRVKQLMAASPASPTAPAPAAELNRIKKLEEKRDALRKQLDAANQKLAARSPKATAAPESKQIKQLESERDALRKKLEGANQQLARNKGKAKARQVQELQDQLASARARLEVFEAKPVPYSPEELALFKLPAANLTATAPDPEGKSVRELPGDTAKMVAEARGYFEARQFDKAEQTYEQVLRREQNNVPVLANLALIQIEGNHLEAAEKHVQQAVALEPQNAYSLSVLGLLKFRQAKYDEAIDALSRAAKLEPENAEVQNRLGLALAEKGLRGPAETAFRKAIQIEPNYASAHNNLAVFYITQKPPYAMLARWHYEKAVAAGQPRNPDLEKQLEAAAKQ